MFHTSFLRKLLKDVFDKKKRTQSNSDNLKYRKQEDLHKGKASVESAGRQQSEIPRQLRMVLDNNQFRLAKEDKEQLKSVQRQKNFYFN